MRVQESQARTTLHDRGPLRRACGCASGCSCRASRVGPGRRTAPSSVRDVITSPGRPLEAPTRARFERHFGQDFSRVRVHTDTPATSSARALGALAYTIGSHIVFDAEAYRPTGHDGERLLTHELAHVVQQSAAVPSVADPPIGEPGDQAEQEAAAVAAGAPPAMLTGGPPIVRRLGANPGCNAVESAAVHQAIFDARGWLNKAIPQLQAKPLPAPVVGSLGRNFGPTYGVVANAQLIAGRLVTARNELSTIPIGCAGAADATCAAGHCGYAAAAGSHAATICSNVTLAAGVDAVFRAGCVLHESLHAAFSRFNVDEYSGWHGHSTSTGTYPGTGTDPLLNADSYTTLVMDLS